MQIADKTGAKPLCFDKTRPDTIDVVHSAVKPAPYDGIYHYHSNIELIYCVSGRLRIILEDSEVSLKSGEWVFLNSYCNHRVDGRYGINEHFSINLNPDLLDVISLTPIPQANFFIKQLPPYCIFPSNEITGYIYARFKKAYENYTSGDYVKRLILQSIVMELMAYVFSNKLPTDKLLTKKEKSLAIHSTKEFINKNFATVTLEDAAENASMSYSHFSRVFKETYGLTFSKYVTRLKVEKSISLLTNTELNITDIAMECGFSNLSHFVKCFKEEKGITPNKFRNVVAKNL
jgi:AraC-like DNA-binding protein